MYKFISNISTFISQKLGAAQFFFQGISVWATLKSKPEAESLISVLTSKPDEFCEIAKTVSEGISENDLELKDAVYIYTLTKQTLAVYEARHSHIPLQVYNELRSALDHYMRAISFAEGDLTVRSSHIKSMSGHIQRAFLDVCKLSCVQVVEKINKFHRLVGDKAVSIAKDGEYIKEITEKLTEAELLFAKAKQKEYEIDGKKQKADANSDVRSSFVLALSAHAIALSYFQENKARLMFCKAKAWTLAGIGAFVGIFIGFVSTFSGKLFAENFSHTETGVLIGKKIVEFEQFLHSFF